MTRFRHLALAALLVFSAPAFAADPPKVEAPKADAPAFSDTQKSAIEQIVREVLDKNPEIIMNAAQSYQKRQAEEAGKKAEEAVTKSHAQLFNDPKDPIQGNPKGNIQIVEFFDYNCGYCKKAWEPLNELVKSEKDVKIIYKQLPILAESSKTAAKAVLAADMQGKYLPLHNALLDHKGSLDEATIMDLAAKAGVDKDKMKKDMESPEVATRLANSEQLAGEIGAHGTPTFLFEDKVVPGAMSLEEMKKLVAEIRERKKT